MRKHWKEDLPFKIIWFVVAVGFAIWLLVSVLGCGAVPIATPVRATAYENADRIKVVEQKVEITAAIAGDNKRRVDELMKWCVVRPLDFEPKPAPVPAADDPTGDQWAVEPAPLPSDHECGSIRSDINGAIVLLMMVLLVLYLGGPVMAAIRKRRAASYNRGL